MSDPPAREDPVGICVSGGGVRAASFGLGALQAVQDEQGLLYGAQRAKYLAAVSGGSYIAGAMTMLASSYGIDEPELSAEPGDRNYPFAPGTPEVEYLRRHARYLAGQGVAETVLQFVMRLAMNLGFLAAAIFVVARPAGWLYGWRLSDLANADNMSAVDLGGVYWLTAAGLVLAGLGIILVLGTIFFRKTLASDRLRVAIRVLFAAVAVLLVVGLVIPEWLGFIANRWVTDKDPTTLTGAPEASVPWTFGATVAAIAAAIASFKSLVPEGVGKTIFSRRVRPLLIRLLRLVTALVAVVAVPLAIFAFASAMMIAGALNVPWEETDNWGWVGEVLLFFVPLGALLIATKLKDPGSWSLHPFYKRRLMSCFCVRRDPNDPLGASERPYRQHYRLSQSKSDALPALLVCAAANVSGFGSAPAGQNVLPFAFSHTEIGFTNADGKTLPTGALETALEGKEGAKNVTLPAAVAITGAAFSPSMGKMTKGPVRALMAVFNLRLGVWLPNPANSRVREAVLPASTTSTNRRRLTSRPEPYYFLREVVGRNRYDARFIYVSDGGHYENLGLVELLRKNCRTIWCVDASGDKPGETSTLTEAMLLAESELGVRWTNTEELEDFGLNEEATKNRGCATVRRTHASISYELSNGEAGTATVVKLGIAEHSPDHLVDYQRRHPSFPYDSTGNQLFRADRFDAYRSLGYASMQEAGR